MASLPSMLLIIVFEKEWKRGKPLKGKDAQLKLDAMKTIKNQASMVEKSAASMDY